MLRKFQLISRHIWKNKLFTTLNVLGLSIGIAAAWIIFKLVLLEYNYDKGQPDANRIFQVVINTNFEGKEYKFGGTPKSVYASLKNDLTGIELITPLYYQYRESLKIVNDQGVEKKGIKTSDRQVATTSDVFKLLNYEFLAGNPNNCLDKPDQIVLTASRAKILFPNESADNILGKTIIFNDTIPLQVSAIVKDLDYLNSFNLEEIVPLNEEDANSTDWSSLNSDDILFIKVKEEQSIANILNNLNKISEEKNKINNEKYNTKKEFDFLPLEKVHFSPQTSYHSRGVNEKVMWGLICVSIFLLVLGCINYTNLSTAQIPQRAKSIGIQKTLGGESKDIIKIFLTEAFIITTIATILAIMSSNIIASLLSDYLPNDYFQYSNIEYLIVFSLILIVSLTFISGIYPAWLSTKLSIVKILKGQVTNQTNPRKFNLRKGLIVFQFIVAQFFIICAIIIGQQIQYSFNKDLGFNKEAIVSIDIPYETRNKPAYKGKQFLLKEKLSNNPNITMVALGDLPMKDGWLGMSFNLQSDSAKKQMSLKVKHIDQNYIELYQMSLIAGRNIRGNDSTTECLINESTIEKYGIKDAESAIGNIIKHDNGKSYSIVGVVKNFHITGFQTEITPTILYMNMSNLNTINFKLPINRSGDWQETLTAIENDWKTIYAGYDFNYKFYDQVIENLYVDEIKMSSLVKITTGISIFISCLGLFGLSTITAFQRSKELGIRKVLGASITQIISLLSKEFFTLILISILIASPFAWWMMNEWLKEYAFKIKISAWIFFLAGGLTILFALLTISYQSIKAARTNPAISLRDE